MATTGILVPSGVGNGVGLGVGAKVGMWVPPGVGNGVGLGVGAYVGVPVSAKQRGSQRAHWLYCSEMVAQASSSDSPIDMRYSIRSPHVEPSASVL